VRELLGLPMAAPLSPGQWQVLLSVWSAVHGFAHLALAGQFAAIAPPQGPESLLRDTVAPMLERQLTGLRLTSEAAGRGGGRAAPARGRAARRG
jgi:hypothetical protein